MKAVVFPRYGSPEVLKLDEVPKPVPKDKEVRIEVRAASLNSWDWELLNGRPFVNRLMFGLFQPRILALGLDVAGRVDAVGKDVNRFKPGDEVFGDISGCGFGAFAEFVCAQADVLALKSPEMSFEEAAAMPQAAVIALQALRYKGQVRKGQKILINGAGGGVGTFGVQMAKSVGAEVTGVDSPGKQDFMRSIGFDHVIDYTGDDFTRTGERYDRILDVVGRRSLFECKHVLSSEGVYVMVGGSTARIFQCLFLGPWISRTTDQTMGILFHKPNRKDLEVLNALFESGQTKPVIDGRYPLSEVPQALRKLGDGQVKGKAVIVLG